MVFCLLKFKADLSAVFLTCTIVINAGRKIAILFPFKSFWYGN